MLVVVLFKLSNLKNGDHLLSRFIGMGASYGTVVIQATISMKQFGYVIFKKVQYERTKAGQLPGYPEEDGRA
jgi:hypothetical protein